MCCSNLISIDLLVRSICLDCLITPCDFVNKLLCLFYRSRSNSSDFVDDIVRIPTNGSWRAADTWLRDLTFWDRQASPEWTQGVKFSAQRPSQMANYLYELDCNGSGRYDTPAQYRWFSGHGEKDSFETGSTGAEPQAMSSTPLPSLEAIVNGISGPTSPLAVALGLLFESSPILTESLEPQVAQILQALPVLHSYSQLIDLAVSQVTEWESGLQAKFIAGHPRIGETKNLSVLSANEQGASAAHAPTDPQVLGRLTHLNECYEHVYPGLRYITFVNGRSRAAIVEEMEGNLGLSHSLAAQPPAAELQVIPAGSDAWYEELERAVRETGNIAKSRLSALE